MRLGLTANLLHIHTVIARLTSPGLSSLSNLPSLRTHSVLASVHSRLVSPPSLSQSSSYRYCFLSHCNNNIARSYRCLETPINAFKRGTGVSLLSSNSDTAVKGMTSTTDSVSHAHTDILWTTSRLASELSQYEKSPDKKERIWLIDGSWLGLPIHAPRNAKMEHRLMRIHGAHLFDINELKDKESRLPHMLPPPKTIEQWVESLVAEKSGSPANYKEDRFVVYDSLGTMSAPRVWWMLKTYGFDKVHLLDGGLPLWYTENRPVDTTPIKETKLVLSTSQFPSLVPVTMDTSFVASYEDVVAVCKKSLASDEASLSKQHTAIIDVRSFARYAAIEDEPRPGVASGHIPHSINLPYSELLVSHEYQRPLSSLVDIVEGDEDGDDDEKIPLSYSRLINPEEIEKRVREAFGGRSIDYLKTPKVEGEDVGGPSEIITTCGSGVTASILYFALRLIGVDSSRIRVYDGSWAEWSVKAPQEMVEAGPQKVH